MLIKLAIKPIAPQKIFVQKFGLQMIKKESEAPNKKSNFAPNG